MYLRIISFLKKNYLLLILLVYGIFIMFFKSAGSLNGDEVFYGQVARETLQKNSFLTLYWRGEFWFEKPPLMIWLTMLAFRFFGETEMSAHFFPGVFGILGAVLVYFFGSDLFKNKMAGFFSGFILLSIPMYIWGMRSNMMDVPVGFFIGLSIFSLWHSVHTNYKWLMVFGGSVGLAILTKNIIGLFPLIIFGFLLIFQKEYRKVLLSHYLYFGLIIVGLIVIPWHVVMVVKYGNIFLRDYFGYHVMERFLSPILHSEFDNVPFSYLNFLFQRSGIWSFVLVGILFFSMYYFKEYKKTFYLLGAWIVFFISPFFLAKTKLPHYMIPIYFPIALLIGGILWEMVLKKSYGLFVIFTLSLLNFLPFFALLTSDFGESHIFIQRLPIFLARLMHGLIPDFFLTTIVFCVVIFIVLYLFYVKKNFIVIVAAIIFMGFIIPFRPDRGPVSKEIGNEITKLSKNKEVSFFVLSDDELMQKDNLTFYLPVGSKVRKFVNSDLIVLDKNGSDYCYFDKSLFQNQKIENTIFSDNNRSIARCNYVGQVF